MNVFVLTIADQFEYETKVFESEADRNQALQAFIKERWSDVFDDPVPATISADRIDEYFLEHPEYTYEVDEVPIIQNSRHAQFHC